MKSTKFQYEEICFIGIDLCNDLFSDLKSSVVMDEQLIETIDSLIEMDPPSSLYGGLLTLHPHPRKEYLFPHINEKSLRIICLSKVLNLELTNEEELKEIFFASFNLVIYHLWKSRGIEFINIFQKKYPDVFKTLINEV